jgi:hypothetical protein
MRVLIKSTNLRDLKSRKTGQAFFIQSAALESGGHDFPQSFDILHDDPKKAYPPGAYEFAPDAIYVSRDGKLSVSPRLVAIRQSTAPKAG